MNKQRKQLFFSEGVHSPFPKESILIYEPFWQLGIVDNKEDQMKRLENLLGVESSKEERKFIQKRLASQKQAVKDALDKGEVVAWVGPSAAEELAFMELAQTLPSTENLVLRIISGPLQLRERAPELVKQLTEYTPFTKKEWSAFLPVFSEMEREKIAERMEPFVYKMRPENYFDAELLVRLSENGKPMRPTKLLGEMYAKRPDLPVPFYRKRINFLVETGIIERVGNDITVHSKVHLSGDHDRE